MRVMCRWFGVLLAVLCATTGRARADDADDLVAYGEQLGKQGEWTQAIAKFKRADALKPSPDHACLIALAYTRRELWAQAELFLARCHARGATPPLPDWVGDLERQLATKLAGAEIPAITIAVDAAGATAAISISSFERDETVPPGTIHLPQGHYTILVTAPDYIPARRDLDVVSGQPQHVAIALVHARRPNPARATRVPWYVLGAGVALAGAGLVVDYAEVQPLRDEMARSQFAFHAHSDELAMWRATAIGLWAAGAVALGIGTWLEVRRREQPLMILGGIDRESTFVAVRWTR
jgi:hypothetical protein